MKDHSRLIGHLSFRIALAWFAGFFVLGFTSWLGEMVFSRQWGIESQMRFAMQGVVMSALIVPIILILRKYIDQHKPADIGIGRLRTAIETGALGASLVLIPLALTLLATSLFGWAVITLNGRPEMITELAFGMIAVVLFEAIPEELIFRGYVFSNLNTRFSRWLSGLISLALFVLLPILLIPVQHYILGLETYIGGANQLTIGYAINLILFGAFVLYLRVLTGTIWAGVAFHLAFVYINKLMGIENTNLIQFSNLKSELGMQLTFGGLVLTAFAALVLYPRIAKKPLGWKDVAVS